MKGRRFDLSIGVFILVGVAAVAYMILKFGGMSTGKGYQVAVLFDDLGGLVKGAPVRLMGVECGRVSETRIIPWEGIPGTQTGHKVRVVVWMRREYDLRSDYDYKIAVDNLLGEKVLEIYVPERPDPHGRDLRKDRVDVVEGINPEGVLGPLERVLEVWGEEETQNNIRKIGQNLAGVTKNLEEWTGDELRGPVRETVAGLSKAVSDLRAVMVDLREAVKAISGAGEEAERLLAENREQVGAVLGRAVHTLESLDRVVDDLYPVVREVKAGRGTLGMLISDPGLYVNLNKAVMAMRKYNPLNMEKDYEEEQRALKREPVERLVSVR